MPRMPILNSVEREAFDSPPVFTSAQRKQYFNCPSPVRRMAASLRHPPHRLGLLLSAGYFKAAKRFFPPSAFHPRDIDYVARLLEPTAPTVGAVEYHPRTHQRHQTSIRAFYGFRVFTSDASRLLLKDIASMVQSHVKPKVIFWRCVDLLVRERIEVPGYTRLTKLIRGAINRHSHDLAAILEDALTRDVRALLDQLLTQEPVGGMATPGKTSAYKLTLMKQLSQSTKPSKVKERVADWDVVRDLYHHLTPALHAVALKPGGIVYYARIVLQSEIFQLRVGTTSIAICISSPLLRITIIGFRTTWSTPCSPACGTFSTEPSVRIRNSVTLSGSSVTVFCKRWSGSWSAG